VNVAKLAMVVRDQDVDAVTRTICERAVVDESGEGR